LWIGPVRRPVNAGPVLSSWSSCGIRAMLLEVRRCLKEKKI
jgi:hypothetical protein